MDTLAITQLGWRLDPKTSSYASLSILNDPSNGVGATDNNYAAQVIITPTAANKGGEVTLKKLIYDFDMTSPATTDWSVTPTANSVAGYDLTLTPTTAATLLKIKSDEAALRFEHSATLTPDYWQLQPRLLNPAADYSSAGYTSLVLSSKQGKQVIVNGAAEEATTAPGGTVLAKAVSATLVG